MDPAQRCFLSWLKRGFGAQLRGPEDNSDDDLKVIQQVTVALSINANGPKRLAAEVDVNLYGPGNVTGLDSREVIRTWPAVGVFDAESNLYPLIEFHQPDLPWRYTPAQANSQNWRLRPWLCLIALADDEIKSFSAVTELKLATVQAGHLAHLPDLSQSWAWAHVQVSGLTNPTAANTLKLLETNPAAVISRLICLRPLRPKTSYNAFLVPTFDLGVKAALGQPSGQMPSTLAPAWKKCSANDQGDAPLLPVLYQWRFQTNQIGDFKYFVNQLEPRPLPDKIGLRVMSVDQPGDHLPDAASPPQIMLEGALMSPASQRSDWPGHDTVAQSFIQNAQHQDLQTLLDTPSIAKNLPDMAPALVPPLYGAWHANSDRLLASDSPEWFKELNRDPRYRVAAGLGMQVVQDQEQQLLAGAWSQVGEIIKINEGLRHTQLSQNVSLSTYQKNFNLGNAEEVLQVTVPFHGRVKGSPFTIKKMIEQSPIPTGALEPQMRRIRRPFGPVGRRQSRDLLPKTSSLLARLNARDLETAPPPATPTALATPDRVFDGLVPKWLTSRLLELLSRLPWLLLIIGIVLLLVALMLFVVGVRSAAIAVAAAGLASVGFVIPARNWVNSLRTKLALRDDSVTPQQIQEIPPRPGFVARTYPVASSGGAPSPSDSGGGVDSPSAAAFRGAAVDLLRRLQEPPGESQPLQELDLEAAKTKLLTSLHPTSTAQQRMQSRLTVSADFTSNVLSLTPSDPLAEVIAAPTFPQPMYKPLKAFSDDWIIPGLDSVPQNTISLLETNQRFIEAYMTGLNHEMARKLMWNGYPTDQPATYFRQFWDVSGAYAGDDEDEPESLKDITPMNAWTRQSHLGQHKPNLPNTNSGQLVLLIRGELLHRYPNVDIYVTKALKDRGRHVLSDKPEDEQHPPFHGSFGADTRFLGFNLDVKQATGADGSEGYFFVLQELPHEPQFGFDVATGPSQYDQLLKNNSTNAADLAHQALRQPIRLAIHASRMLEGLT